MLHKFNCVIGRFIEESSIINPTPGITYLTNYFETCNSERLYPTDGGTASPIFIYMRLDNVVINVPLLEINLMGYATERTI